MQLPIARTADLIQQEIGKELLIYDLRTNQAYNLNETSRIIYESCDGKTGFDELKRSYKFTDDLIYFAIDELKNNNLLENYQNNHFAGVSRREVIRRVGLATLIAFPLIASLTAPKAVDAASGVDLCQEVECPYAQTQCMFDGKCDQSTGDCIEIFKPNGTPCDDGNAGTIGDTCDGNGNCVGAAARRR